ncbi:MFS transporter [Planobispora takensis]|uniref:MFS transporter n=1 Tax=Planobispora takensis TaxID=1367882 RepID=A0A8J3T0D1_9ACTN|nr:MFS transporter [Planobispora takensis]
MAAVTFVALVGAAGFRATPGALIEPLQREFGWSRGTISLAVSVNLLLFGLTAPFAAALMERFGIRRVIACALSLVALGSGLTVFMTTSWQLVLLWGVLVGLGTGSMALALVATVTGRWFVRHRGLVTGVLTAGGATGQLVFLPLVAALSEAHGWRAASLVTAGAALAVVPPVLLLLRERPADVGLRPYGAAEPEPVPGPGRDVRTGGGPARGAGPGQGAATGTGPGQGVARGAGSGRGAATGSVPAVGPARRAIGALREAAGTRAFWFLAAGFAICGATTNGLVGTHFIPAAHDHGMPVTTAAGLLALVGIFDIAGTVFSGWLTDRVDSRILLAVYYALRGASLLVLPQLFAASAHPSMLVFIIFYGLDWVATVPPTVALCREHFGEAGPVVFGWVFASHQIGAALAATAAGLTRDHFGDYAPAWYVAGALSIVAAVVSMRIRRGARPDESRQGPRAAGLAAEPAGR